MTFAHQKLKTQVQAIGIILLFLSGCKTQAPVELIGSSEERITAKVLKEFLTDEEGSMSISIRNRPVSQELINHLNRIFRVRSFHNDEEDVQDSSRLAVYQIEEFQSKYIYFRIEILDFLFQLNFAIIVDESQEFRIIDVVELEWFEEVDLESYAPPANK